MNASRSERKHRDPEEAIKMQTTTDNPNASDTTSSLGVRTSVKAGGFTDNHSEGAGLRVRTSLMNTKKLLVAAATVGGLVGLQPATASAFNPQPDPPGVAAEADVSAGATVSTPGSTSPALGIQARVGGWTNNHNETLLRI